MDKTFRCVYGGIDVRDVGTGLDKRRGWILGGGTLVVVHDYRDQTWYGL